MAPATGFDLRWESQPGKLYNLRTSTDLTDSIAAWDIVEGNIEATPPANHYHIKADAPRRFFAVEELEPQATQ